MSAISSLTRFLPPVTWSSQTDPDQFLARMLRIYEKQLVGLETGATVVNASAQITGSNANTVTLVNESDSRQFRPGDTITIEGTAEREVIDQIINDLLILQNPLLAAHGAGIVRIANLIPGQQQFRVDVTNRLANGFGITLSQGNDTENNDIETLDGEFITLGLPLSTTFVMSEDALPVKVKDQANIVFDGTVVNDFKSFLDQRDRLFNPWRTRENMLPYLAGWLALELREDWSDYQQRKLLSNISDIYKERTLKNGLHRFLNIYAITEAQPRIALDDGEALFRGVALDNGLVELTPITFSRYIETGAGIASFMLHPSAVAVDSQNQRFIADRGDDSEPERIAAIWRLNEAGESPMENSTGVVLPEAIAQDAPATPLEYPVALTVDTADRVSTVDRGIVASGVSTNSAITRWTPPLYTRATVIDQTTVPTLPVVNPIGMVLNADDNYAVLDRGFHALGDPPAGPTLPKITIVSEGPLSVSNHLLVGVEEPSALAIDEQGRYLITDARDQFSNNAVRLWRADPSANWALTDLLAALPDDQNPLVFPTGIQVESPGVYIICDTGLTWGYDPLDPEGADISYRFRAENAALYRVDTNPAIPEITRLTLKKQLVSPTDLAFDNNQQLLISDAGDRVRTAPLRNWRASQHEFGAVVHFSRDRPIAWADRLKVRRNIAKILFTEKPSASQWWMDT